MARRLPLPSPALKSGRYLDTFCRGSMIEKLPFYVRRDCVSDTATDANGGMSSRVRVIRPDLLKGPVGSTDV